MGALWRQLMQQMGKLSHKATRFRAEIEALLPPQRSIFLMKTLVAELMSFFPLQNRCRRFPSAPCHQLPVRADHIPLGTGHRRGPNSPVLSQLIFKSTLKLGKSVEFLCYFMFFSSFPFFLFPWVLNFRTLVFNEEGAPRLASNDAGQRGSGATAVQTSRKVEKHEKKGKKFLRVSMEMPWGDSW